MYLSIYVCICIYMHVMCNNNEKEDLKERNKGYMAGLERENVRERRCNHNL